MKLQEKNRKRWVHKAGATTGYQTLFCGCCRKTCHFYTDLTHCLKVCNKCVRPSQICVLEANPRKMSRHGKGQIMFCSEICKNSLICNKIVTFLYYLVRFCSQIIKKWYYTPIQKCWKILWILQTFAAICLKVTSVS